MARGFESKQVEEQQSLAQSRKKPEGQELTPEQQTRMREKASLEMMQTKIRNDISATNNERHKAMLEMALKDIEQKLKGSD